MTPDEKKMVKFEKRRLVREALLEVARKHAVENGVTGDGLVDPAKLLEPQAKALWDAGLKGDVGAIREYYDRVDGKVQQEIKVDRDSTVHVDAGLLGNIGDLLKLVDRKKEKVVNEIPEILEQK